MGFLYFSRVTESIHNPYPKLYIIFAIWILFAIREQQTIEHKQLINSIMKLQDILILLKKKDLRYKTVSPWFSGVGTTRFELVTLCL